MAYKVFISSRNNDRLALDRKPGATLTELREFLKAELESEKLFGKDFLEIVINEKFATDSSLDSYNQCLKEIEDSNFTIALLSGTAGWAPDTIDIGICHAELARAAEISLRQVSIVDARRFFETPIKNKKTKLQDANFDQYLKDLNRFNHPLKLSGTETEENFKKALLAQFKELISRSIMKRIEDAGRLYLANGGGKKMLEWKAMSYDLRNLSLTKLLTAMVKSEYDEVITVIKAVPDNMSISEALNFAGRSYLSDQDTIKLSVNEKLSSGPIHFVGVYGTVTETQIRKLLGNPDIVTFKDDFGIYVWERTLNIQMVFLTKCTTPEATKTNYNLFGIWLTANGLKDQMHARASARYLILKAFNSATALLE